MANSIVQIPATVQTGLAQPLTDAQLRAAPVPVSASIDTTGLATSAKQDTGNASLTSILAKILSAPSTEAKQDALNTLITTLNSIVATTAKQDTGNTSLSSIDAKLTNPLPVSGTVNANTGLSQPLTDTQLRATPVPVSGTIVTGGLTDTQLRATPVPVSGTVTANAGTNLNTSLLAVEAGGNLAAIKTDVDKIPSQGQALAGASMPVVLTAAQITTLTPPAAITGYNLEATQLLVKAKTDNLDVALSTRLKPADTLTGVTTVAAVTAITNALPAGTNLLGKTGIDQTTPGTTNKVSIGTDGTVAINTALPSGTNVIGHVINDTGSTTAVTGNVAVTNAGLTNIDVALSTRTKPADQQHAIIDSGTTVVTQPTGTNLHTVVDSGVITTVAAVTAITNALPAGNNNIGDIDVASIAAGANVIGKVGIDQTTPGTTNAVAIISGQNGVAGGDGNVDATTQRITIAANVISSVNSSTATLAANAIFTGTSEDIISYSEIRVTVYSDVASATDGLSIQQSTDNSNWVISDTYSIAAATGKTFALPRQARYIRIVYTNGGSAQTTFILQTTYKRIGGSMSSQRASDNYTNETDLEQSQSFLMNYSPVTGTWYRVRGDATNGLYVNPQGYNVEYQRRLQEIQVLCAYSSLMEEVGATERYNSSRDFIEIR